MRSTLEKKQMVITSLDEEIKDLLEKKEIEKEIVERSAFEEEVEGIICQVKSVLSFTAPQNVTAEKSPSKNEAVKIKLPKLSVTRFDGNPTQCATFWDRFNSTIGCNSELSNIDKFKYLQNSLIGEAAQTTTGF